MTFTATPSPLLKIDDLRVEFRAEEGTVRAVDGVSFALHSGETLGIVGESGSGKSVTNLAALGLIPTPPGKIVSGRVLFHGQDLLRLNHRELAQIRGNRIAMIFQDPMTALNPFLTVEEQLTEVTRLHLGLSRAQAIEHAVDMLEQVGIPAAGRRVFDYPHQFSGGMRQRVMIAMALSCQPEILIADEPTTALDVTIQAQILELLTKLQHERGMAIVLITHDLGVVANSCRRVLVMYAGRIVEEADVGSIFSQPRHPYTLGLLGSVPRWDQEQRSKLRVIPGQPPDLARRFAGCSFAPRCEFRQERCERESPELNSRMGAGRAACFVELASRTTTLIDTGSEGPRDD